MPDQSGEMYGLPGLLGEMYGWPGLPGEMQGVPGSVGDVEARRQDEQFGRRLLAEVEADLDVTVTDCDGQVVALDRVRLVLEQDQTLSGIRPKLDLKFVAYPTLFTVSMILK